VRALLGIFLLGLVVAAGGGDLADPALTTQIVGVDIEAENHLGHLLEYVPTLL